MTAKATSPKVSRTVRFDRNVFVALQLVSYEQDYQPAGVSAFNNVLASAYIDENNANILRQLMNDLLEFVALTGAEDPSSKTPNTENLILIKSLHGAFMAAFGPAIFRMGDQPILKIGANIAPITVDPATMKLTCGELSGRLSFIPALDNGVVKYVNIFANLKSADGSIGFEVKLMTREPEVVDGSPIIIDQNYVETAIDTDNFVDVLLPVPQGSGNSARKLAELEVGRTYTVTGCKRVESVINGNPTVSFKLRFAETGDDDFWLNPNHGAPHGLLLFGHNPVGRSLLIADIQKKGRGMSVKCAFTDNKPISNAPML